MATKRGLEHLRRLVPGGHANSAGKADDDELARRLHLLLASLGGGPGLELRGSTKFEATPPAVMSTGRRTSSWLIRFCLPKSLTTVL